MVKVYQITTTESESQLLCFKKEGAIDGLDKSIPMKTEIIKVPSSVSYHLYSFC